MATVKELGAVVERFETDSSRRKRICAFGVPIGVVIACVGVLFLAIGDRSGIRGNPIPAYVIGAGIFAIVVGIWQGWLAFTRRDEVYTLHEDGFVHAYAGKSWAIRWDETAKVTDRSRETPVNHALGTDIRYDIKFHSPIAGSRKIVITLLCAWCAAPFALLVPLTSRGSGLAWFVVGGSVVRTGIVASNVIFGAFRQAYCPPALLGRVVACTRFVVYGVFPIGALLGGILGTALGLRETVWIASTLATLSVLILTIGPLRKQRDLPPQPVHSTATSPRPA